MPSYRCDRSDELIRCLRLEIQSLLDDERWGYLRPTSGRHSKSLLWAQYLGDSRRWQALEAVRREEEVRDAVLKISGCWRSNDKPHRVVTGRCMLETSWRT